jgi:hypothetical protein
MSENQLIESKKVGFSFSLAIEKELRTETGAKYPDKSVLNARLEGNADSFDEVVKLLGQAKTEINKVLTEKAAET